MSAVNSGHELVAAARAELATEFSDHELALFTARGVALSSEEVLSYLASEAERILAAADSA
jgi:hypothetical protein